MKPIDIFLIIIIAAAVAFAVYTIYKKNKSGGCCGGCSHDCDGCKKACDNKKTDNFDCNKKM